MTRILIADDHEVICSGLRRVLEVQPGWEVVAEASDGKDAIRKAALTKPDVAVLDCMMPLVNGVEATRQMNSVLGDQPGLEQRAYARVRRTLRTMSRLSGLNGRV
jgi:DNA-binding NarL/FixJ family response regulator